MTPIWRAWRPSITTCFVFEMSVILHILTQSEDSLAREIITRQKDLPDCTVETVDLRSPEVDYPALLEKIFAADSVEVW